MQEGRQKGVLQETVEWSHDFDRMIGRVLFRCSWQTFKMTTSELFCTISQSAPKLYGYVLRFAVRLFIITGQVVLGGLTTME